MLAPIPQAVVEQHQQRMTACVARTIGLALVIIDSIQAQLESGSGTAVKRVGYFQVGDIEWEGLIRVVKDCLEAMYPRISVVCHSGGDGQDFTATISAALPNPRPS